MLLQRWNNPGRKRRCNISYNDEDYVKYYDIDLTDFTTLVNKLKNNIRLTDGENNRYGIYIITICQIVQENPKFKNKPLNEREEMLEQQYYELLTNITHFDNSRGSSIYSYAYRIGYTAACHYYTNKNKELEYIEFNEELGDVNE